MGHGKCSRGVTRGSAFVPPGVTQRLLTGRRLSASDRWNRQAWIRGATHRAGPFAYAAGSRRTAWGCRSKLRLAVDAGAGIGPLLFRAWPPLGRQIATGGDPSCFASSAR
jgi:hypothetical protein